MNGEFFDLWTVVFCVVLIEIFLSLIMVLYWRIRGGYPGFGLWALSIFIFALTHVSVMVRGIIPDIISILGTNLFSLLGFLVSYDSATRFTTGKPIKRYWYLLILLYILGVTGEYYYIDSVGLRTVFLSVLLGILAFETARAFYLSRTYVKDLFTWLIILNFSIFAVIFILRIIDFGLRLQERTLLESSVSNDFLFIYSLFGAIASCILFIIMNIDRLSRDRDAQTAEIRKLANKYDLAIKAAGAGVWEMNLTTGKLSLDDQIYERLGMKASEGEKISPSLQEFIYPDDLPKIVHQINQVTTEDQELISEYRVINRNGEIRYHLSHARSSVSDDGSYLRLVGMSIDITPLRQTQNALKNAMKKLSMLSSITRHDILNCTTVIKLNLHLLLDDCPDPRDQKKLRAIQDSEEKITHLIQFTREYEDLGLHDPVWIDITSILKRHSMKQLLGNISLQSPERGVKLFVDPMIEKVIYNLIENSIRHGGDVSFVSFSYAFFDSDLMIIYTDDGKGIPSEHKERIFERGFGTNTGMGLFLCREILALTDMSIIEDGVPGSGVRFVMTIKSGLYKDDRTADQEA